MKPPAKFTAEADLSGVALPKWKTQRMYMQGYRFVGRHSAVKICTWAKKSIRGHGCCYKEKFYGICSHQCIQMSPAAFFCDCNCMHCWRSLQFSLPDKGFKWDKPEQIVEGCIKEQWKYIQGFKGSKDAKKDKLSQAEMPKHVAISLSGEPTLYPYLPELIDAFKKKGMTVFLVSNGAHPEMIKKLVNHQPTNLYVTLAAPNAAIYKRECCPIISDGWEKLVESLGLLKEFSCNTVIRLTLSKETNMFLPEEYARLISSAKPHFVEVKAYMAVGGAHYKMGYDAMPSQEEIQEFAQVISEKTGYIPVNSHDDSRVVLLVRKAIN